MLLATTRRNEATLQLFLDSIGSSRLQVQDVTAELAPALTASSSAAATHCDLVRFQCLPWLEAARPRVLLHRITAK
jgi:hypothetical protein